MLITTRIALLAATVTAAALPAATASAAPTTARQAHAEAALEAVQHVFATGEGDASDALHELALSRRNLPAAERPGAAAYFKRPTESHDAGDTSLAYQTTEATPYDTPDGSVRIHWVETTDDAPDLADADHDTVPDFVERLAAAFEHTVARMNGPEPAGLAWLKPKSDGGIDGSNALDVYIAKITADGYVAVDDFEADGVTPQATPHQHAFMVVSKAFFPDGHADGNEDFDDLDVTAAHEYNHVLQNAYNANLDSWLFESNASWAEDQVYPAVTNYYQYVNGAEGWGRLSMQALPFTDQGNNLKRYGLNVFFQYLADKLGPKVVRTIWEDAAKVADTVPAEADGAIYHDQGSPSVDRAIKSVDATSGFAAQFIAFAAAQAEWRTPGNGFHDGPAWEDVDRQPTPMAVGAAARTVTVDHATSKLFDVTGAGASPIAFTGKGAAGKPFAVALVGRKAGGATTTRTAVPGADGVARAELPAGPYERVTAVVVNHSTAATTWDEAKYSWNYTNDGVPVTTTVEVVKPPVQQTQTTTTPPATTVPVPAPPVTPGPVTRVLAVAVGTIKSAKRALLLKGLPVKVTTSKAATVTVTLGASRSVAKALGLGRKAVLLGKGAAKITGAGTVRVTLTSKAKKAIKRRKAVGKRLTLTTLSQAAGEKPVVSTQSVTVG